MTMTAMHRLEADYQKVGNIAREIVAKRVMLLALLGVILSALVTSGAISDKLSSRVDGLAGTGFTFLTVLAGVLWARTGVTPGDPALNPTSTNGLALEEVGGDSTSAVAPSDTMIPATDTTVDDNDPAAAFAAVQAEQVTSQIVTGGDPSLADATTEAVDLDASGGPEQLGIETTVVPPVA